MPCRSAGRRAAPGATTRNRLTPLLNPGSRVAKGAATSAAPMTRVVSRSTGPTSPRPSPTTRTVRSRASFGSLVRATTTRPRPTRSPCSAGTSTSPATGASSATVLRTADDRQAGARGHERAEVLEEGLGERRRRVGVGEPQGRDPERAAVVAVDPHPEGRGHRPADRHRGHAVVQWHLGPLAADPAVALVRDQRRVRRLEHQRPGEQQHRAGAVLVGDTRLDGQRPRRRPPAPPGRGPARPS